MPKDALLRYIRQSGDKPFLLRDYLEILLQDATRATQRQKVAIINEWKRKLYQLDSFDSPLLLNMMQAEMFDLKERAEATEDKTEQDNLKEQMVNLELEYRQQSQRFVYILNKEQAQQQDAVDIPGNLHQLYETIRKTETELQKQRDSLVENPVGEEALQQIMTWRQIAQLEGQLEILQQAEPFAARRLRQRKKEVEQRISQLKSDLSQLNALKVPTLPPEPEAGELEELADLLGSPQLKQRLRNLPEAERADWVEFAKEMGLDDLLDAWVLGKEQGLVGSLSDLSLEELQEIPQGDENQQRRVQSRIKVLLTRRLRDLRQRQRELLYDIEHAETVADADALRRQLLNIELEQNDTVNNFFAAPIDNNLRQALQRLKTNIQATFRRLRTAIDRRKALLLQGQKTIIEEKIAVEEVLLEKFVKEEEKLLSEAPLSEEKPKAKEKTEQKKKPPKVVDETLYVRNAGIVLLSPYFNRLFTMTNLLEKNKFVSEDAQIRAVHLLQYVAVGKTENPENELVLNKIICGLPLDTPVPIDVGLTDEEKNACAALLQGAINNWPRMKTMTPDALRGTFIVREGSLNEEADRWKLKVERGSFDMLLRTIPWGFTFIRHGWMPKFIMVDWELPGN